MKDSILISPSTVIGIDGYTLFVQQQGESIVSKVSNSELGFALTDVSTMSQISLDNTTHFLICQKGPYVFKVRQEGAEIVSEIINGITVIATSRFDISFPLVVYGMSLTFSDEKKRKLFLKECIAEAERLVLTKNKNVKSND